MVELPGIGSDGRRQRAQLKHELVGLAERSPQHGDDGGGDGIEIDLPELQDLPAAECQQLLGDSRGPFRGLPDLVDVLARGLRQVRPAQEKVRRAQHDGHLVVRLVRDPPRKLSGRLQPLAVP